MTRSADPSDGVDGERIRVTLELSRSDDPLLFDALVSLKKGRRRVARLRTLAHDGLLAAKSLAAGAPAEQGHVPLQQPGDELDGERRELADLDPGVTGGVFGPPVDA